MSPLTFTAFALVLLGCGAKGVSLGSEEPCVPDARLVAAQERAGGVFLSTCATVGKNRLLNPGMESPVVASVSGCTEFCQVGAAQVSGWETTSEAQHIEIWTDGHWDVLAPEGAQFVELDTQTPDTVYQHVALSPGEPVYWSVLHRGRLGDETIEVFLGPPETPISQGLFQASDVAWLEHSGIYQVGPDERVTRFSLASRSGTTRGNLVDNALLAPIELVE